MSQSDSNSVTPSPTNTPTQRESRMSFIEVKKAIKGFPILGKENITVKEWATTLEYFFSSEKWTSEKNIFEACLLTTTGLPYSIVSQLKRDFKDDEGNSAFPPFEDIKKTLLIDMDEEPDPDELYEKIRNYRIRDRESVKEFNRRFMKVYRELPSEFQSQVTAFTYSDAIKNRFEPWKKVAKKRKTCSLMEVMRIAEEEDKYEKLNKRNSASSSRTSKDNSNKSVPSLPSSSFSNGNKRALPPKEPIIPSDDTIDNLTEQFSKMRIHVCYRCGQKGHHARFCTNEISDHNVQLLQKLNDQGHLNQ